jgi:hypothetical protein
VSRKMHLGSLSYGAGGHVAGWRVPGADVDSENFAVIASAVRTAERGKFDFVFFADAVHTAADAPPGVIVRFEPLTLLGALSAVTEKIGLVATVSTTYSQPYNAARMLSSLDHLSKGRIGWNVVTTSSPDSAANFGMDKQGSSYDHRPRSRRTPSRNRVSFLRQKVAETIPLGSEIRHAGRMEFCYQATAFLNNQSIVCQRSNFVRIIG